MTAAVSSSTSATATGAAPTTTGLSAQLARYKKEYSACVNCESATTQEGKRNIQQLDIKIKQIESRIEAVTPTRASSDIADTRSSTAGQNAASSTSSQQGLVDVYA